MKVIKILFITIVFITSASYFLTAESTETDSTYTNSDAVFNYNAFIWGIRVGKLTVTKNKASVNSSVINFAGGTSGIGRAFRSARISIYSSLNTNTLLPYKTYFSAEEGGKKTSNTATYNRKNNTYTIEYQDKKENTVNTMPPNTYDISTMLFKLRLADISPDKPVSLRYVFNDRVWGIELKYRKQETISVPAGRFQCYLLEGTAYRLDRKNDPAAHREVMIWVTTDNRKIVAKGSTKIKLGHIVVELTGYSFQNSI